jgi:hypothetical protein
VTGVNVSHAAFDVAAGIPDEAPIVTKPAVPT